MRAIPLFTLVSAFAASPASAGTGHWEIHEAERFCYMWLPAAASGGTDVGIAMDAAGRSTVILSNDAWRLQKGKSYKLSAQVGEASRLEEARGIKIKSKPEIVAVAAEMKDPSFASLLAASASVQFDVEASRAEEGASPREAVLDRHNLAGAAQALGEVQRCAGRKRNQNAQMTMRQRFRPDPPAVWIRPDSKN